LIAGQISNKTSTFNDVKKPAPSNQIGGFEVVCCGYKPLAEILTQLSKKKTAAKKYKIMKTKILVLAAIILTAISCSKNDDDTSNNLLNGTWKLAEVLADPGDGSGTFNSVNSNKNLIFSNGGNLSSNGAICDMSIETNASSTGTYSEVDSTINSTHCPNITLKYELNGNTLILIYPCIEPCKAKYSRVQ
jgi:hypothetical protein